MRTTEIRDFYGKILGYIEEESNGNKTAKNFYRQILGTYNAKENVTKDFYGRIVSRGDTTQSLVYNNNNDTHKAIHG